MYCDVAIRRWQSYAGEVARRRALANLRLGKRATRLIQTRKAASLVLAVGYAETRT